MTTGTGTATARCPTNHPYLIGGGAVSTETVQQSGPSGMMSGHPGWTVMVKLSGARGSDVYAFAACSK